MDDGFYYLGTLTKPFGLKGGLCAFFDSDHPENYLSLSDVFLDLDGEKIPYAISELTYRGNGQFILYFKDIPPEEVRDYVGVELYLPLSVLPELPDDRFYFHEVIGFKVIDVQYGEVGTCTSFLEISNNPLMSVDAAGKEVLIPANRQFIDKVDRENRILFVKTPEGFLDIYLG